MTYVDTTAPSFKITSSMFYSFYLFFYQHIFKVKVCSGVLARQRPGFESSAGRPLYIWMHVTLRAVSLPGMDMCAM
jgi:hypothetical protein